MFCLFFASPDPCFVAFAGLFSTKMRFSLGVHCGDRYSGRRHFSLVLCFPAFGVCFAKRALGESGKCDFHSGFAVVLVILVVFSSQK